LPGRSPIHSAKKTVRIDDNPVGQVCFDEMIWRFSA